MSKIIRTILYSLLFISLALTLVLKIWFPGISDTTSFKETLAILEMLYYVSSFVLAFAAVKALTQLDLAQTDMHIRAKREAVTSCVEQCNNFTTQIMPLFSELDNDASKKGIEIYTGEIDIDFAVSTELDNWNENNLKKIDDDFYNKAINAFNTLEIFSAYFICGISDEKIAFLSHGAIFCSYYKQYYPVLLYMVNEDTESHYDLIKQLYNIWAPRREKLLLQRKAEQLNITYKSLKKKEESISDKSIDQIGYRK